jgi:AcrR family transcriptional regulator
MTSTAKPKGTPKRKRAPRRSTYHHGDLREAFMTAALAAIARNGVASVSLRELARELGVSHSAPAHHFPDRIALFTALAAAGFDGLHARMSQAIAAAENTPAARLSAAGQGYVLFAAENAACFEVMFHPKLLRNDDPVLATARDNASRVLQEAISAVQGTGKKKGRNQTQAFDVLTLHAWSVAHGLASLWLAGNITRKMWADSIEELSKRMFGGEGW